ncbi:hypothetical protein [Intrasporangium flavum]|uniref:hypothetical protein n=1 Tax=Intrasporangium flavum TaxID=1428657 RepID=UPI00096C0B39|nr:hypothetical protein [Intrasporangium flavum]
MSRSLSAIGRKVGTVVLCALLGAAMFLGGWRTQVLLSGPPDPKTLTVGSVTYTVTDAVEVAGLSSADLGGMTHGVQSLVSDDKALVRVALRVTAGDVDTDYDASVLQAVVEGQTKGIQPVGGSLPVQGHLAAHSHLEGSLSFVIPRGSARVVLTSATAAFQVPLLYLSPGEGDSHGDSNGDSNGDSHGNSHDAQGPPAGPSAPTTTALTPGFSAGSR